MSKLDAEGSGAMDVDCVAAGARPAPAFKWFIGGEEINVRAQQDSSSRIHSVYRVTHHLKNLVGLIKIWRVSSAFGCWAASVAIYCLSKLIKHPNSESTPPGSRVDGTTCTQITAHVCNLDY